MTNYYSHEKEYADRGIDYDLFACLNYNRQDGFDVDSIQKVLAVTESFNEGPDWHWILLLKDGRFVYLQGGCDYTGWDCQSSAISWIESDMASVLAHCDNNDRYEGETENRECKIELARQLMNVKSETWREQKDKEFGL